MQCREGAHEDGSSWRSSSTAGEPLSVRMCSSASTAMCRPTLRSRSVRGRCGRGRCGCGVDRCAVDCCAANCCGVAAGSCGEVKRCCPEVSLSWPDT